MIKKSLSSLLVCLMCICTLVGFQVAAADSYSAFLTVSDTEGVTVKQEGYYHVFSQDANTKKWNCIVEGKLLEFDSLPKEFVSGELTSGGLLEKNDCITAAWESERTVIVMYSKDGKTLTSQWEVKVPAHKVVPTTTIDANQLLPQIKATVKKISDTEAQIHVDLQMTDLAKQREVGVKYLKLQSKVGYSDMYFTDGTYKTSYDFPVDKNGTYTIVASNMYLNETRLDVTVDCIVTEEMKAEQLVSAEPDLSLTVKTDRNNAVYTDDASYLDITVNKKAEIYINGSSIGVTDKAIKYEVRRNGSYTVLAVALDSLKSDKAAKTVEISFYKDFVAKASYDEKLRDVLWEGDFGNPDFLSGTTTADTLPNTGGVKWFAVVGVFLLGTTAGVLLLLKSKGVIRLPERKRVQNTNVSSLSANAVDSDEEKVFSKKE